VNFYTRTQGEEEGWRSEGEGWGERGRDKWKADSMLGGMEREVTGGRARIKGSQANHKFPLNSYYDIILI